MSAHGLITVVRHGPALDITVDGVPLPRLVTTSIAVDDTADRDMPTLTLTLAADRILFDSCGYEPEADDGETPSQDPPEATENSVRLSGRTQVPDP